MQAGVMLCENYAAIPWLTLSTLQLLMRFMPPGNLIRFLLIVISAAHRLKCCPFQALAGCTKCIQANSQNVECLIRRCRWAIDLSEQKPDAEKLPLMCVPSDAFPFCF